jgi:hypothetical protein
MSLLQIAVVFATRVWEGQPCPTATRNHGVAPPRAARADGPVVVIASHDRSNRLDGRNKTIILK